MNEGRVYFISGPGRIKIGYTKRPEYRLRQLRCSDLEEIIPIGVISGTRALEKKLHTLASAHRIRGEWFNDCAEVRAIMDDAIAGKISVDIPEAAPLPEAPLKVQLRPIDLVLRLADESIASVERGENKYETRGKMSALVAAMDLYLNEMGR
jgi:hypothetical protein